MFENVFEVLMYLFDNYIAGARVPAKDRIIEELEVAGFSPLEITKAFKWYEGMVELQEATEWQPYDLNGPIRVFTDVERHKLTEESQGLILHLISRGVLDPLTRELAIDRAMALDLPIVDTYHMERIILLILYALPGRDDMYAWMEEYVYTDYEETKH